MLCTQLEGVDIVKMHNFLFTSKGQNALIEAAYNAVHNEYYLPVVMDKNWHDRSRAMFNKIDETWRQGPEVIGSKTRISPVIMMRGLVAYYLDRKGLTMGYIARMIGDKHRTSAIHARNTFQASLSLKFSVPEKDVLNAFYKLIVALR